MDRDLKHQNPVCQQQMSSSGKQNEEIQHYGPWHVQNTMEEDCVFGILLSMTPLRAIMHSKQYVFSNRQREHMKK